MWKKKPEIRKPEDLLYPEESYAILGACFSVYREHGCGFLEAVYQECLEIEFEHMGIPFQAQRELRLAHRGRQLRQSYQPDFICFDKIILEIKAVSKIIDEHRAQVLNYLNATRNAPEYAAAGGIKLGLLINFGHHPKIEHQRFALTQGTD